MSHPNSNFCVGCIDKRFDYLLTTYLNSIVDRNDYYLGTTTGSSLCLGYKKYCKDMCNRCDSKNGKCNPYDTDMILLKKSLLKNMDISQNLADIKSIYLIDHQDCGGIKTYLKCSGYPQILGENNKKDIEVNTQLLIIAKKYLNCKYPELKIRLGLIDINGTVADFIDKKWSIVYIGNGTNSKGLWWNYQQ